MKKQFSIGMLAVAGFTSLTMMGCKKFLDRKPLNSVLTDYAQGGIEPQALGLYGALRNSAGEPYIGDGFQSIPWIGINGFRSEDQEIVSDPGAAQWHATYDNFNYTKDDWASGVYWDKHYLLINNCNTILQLADSLNLNDPSSQVNIAEAKWFRALSYWDLVRNYGEVPKIDFRIYTSTQAQVPKATETQILDLIEADLLYGTTHLPQNWPAKFAGRLTSGAAKTLLAKVYVWRRKWSQALALCQEVINSGEYQLYPDYAKLWKTENELSKESIFEIQAAYAPGDGGQLWSWFGTAQGVRGNGADGWDLGWGWNTPTASLVNAYEPGDPRKAATILFSGQYDGGEATGGYGETMPPYTNALYWNKKAYTSNAERAASGSLNGSFFMNCRLLRYADVILIAAESANEVGNGPLAETYLEMIRARARGGNNAVLPKVLFVNQAQMRTAIKQERRVEFGCEFERFWDLVRWGDASSVLSGLGYQPKNHWYPLPSSAIASNPRLVQNPDYP